MSNRKALKGAIAAIASVATLGDTKAGTGQYTTPAVLESHSTERGCYGPQGKTDGSSNDALKRCLASQLKENGGIGSISEQLLDTRADVTIGGGSKYFRQTVQGGECAGKTVWEQVKEMGYQTVENDPAAMNALIPWVGRRRMQLFLAPGISPVRYCGLRALTSSALTLHTATIWSKCTSRSTMMVSVLGGNVVVIGHILCSQ